MTEDTMTTKQLVEKAKDGSPVYISDVRAQFDSMADRMQLICELELIDDTRRRFPISVPDAEELSPEANTLIANYIWARIYNILSSLGGRRMTIYLDRKHAWLNRIVNDLNVKFGIYQSRKDRKGYGRSINVIDRMLEHIDSRGKEAAGFQFVIKDIAEKPEEQTVNTSNPGNAVEKFRASGSELAGKIMCGVDVGGTDIKIAAAVDGNLACLKEFDWFPAEYTVSKELIDPIVLLVRLIRARLTGLTSLENAEQIRISGLLESAMGRKCPLAEIEAAVEAAEAALGDQLISFDAIGLCFPDVVVKNKIVGGEVYKTRGIRNNTQLDYEVEFRKLSDLDLYLKVYCAPEGVVRITNDGPMASFTAAVEQSVSSQPDPIAAGVFAHTLGTELGTGWIDDAGTIPDIPLEVYNYIIDLGSYPEQQFPCDDLRSINNFNTGLAGTLQKYASQSGVFRLAIKYFSKDRPDLYEEMVNRGYIVKREVDGIAGLYVPTEPVDLRKPFLEYLMGLVDMETCGPCDSIFIDIGRFLAVTWAETDLILNPRAKTRVLFGRLVKNAGCFSLIQKGAKELYPDLAFEVADGTIANTSLMKQLEADKEYTVAQFAQAIGAIYFGNAGRLS